MPFYVRRKKHLQLYLHLAIDSGGMTPFWVTLDQATQFTTRDEAEEFMLKRFIRQYPQEEAWIDEQS